MNFYNKIYFKNSLLLSTLLKKMPNLFRFKSQYSIKRGYRHRNNVISFDDSNNQDRYQKEVYEDALKLFSKNNYKTVLDIGCGSGFKLINYFKYKDFIGIEIEPTLKFLKNKYPNYKWEKLEFAFGKEYDIVILSDVIEHVKCPQKFLEEIIEKIKFKYIVISTPDRNLLYKLHYGPPKNPSHYREWNFNEFHNFIKLNLQIESHYISNYSQATQVIICSKYN